MRCDTSGDPTAYSTSAMNASSVARSYGPNLDSMDGVGRSSSRKSSCGDAFISTSESWKDVTDGRITMPNKGPTAHVSARQMVNGASRGSDRDVVDGKVNTVAGGAK